MLTYRKRLLLLGIGTFLGIIGITSYFSSLPHQKIRSLEPIQTVTIVGSTKTPIYTEQSDGSTRDTISYQTSSTILGKGVLLNQSGYILTNKHVVQDLNQEYTVEIEKDKTYPIKKIWHHPDADLAIIQFDPQNSYYTGSFENITNDTIQTTLLMSKIPVKKGNSGSPLINNNGEIIGIITAMDSVEQDTAYSISINKSMVSKILDSVIRFGTIQ